MATVFLLATLSGCTVFEGDAARNSAEVGQWNIKTLVTTASDRIVTVRKNPVTGHDVMCTEPAPDVAVALSTQAALTAQGGSGLASGSLSASGASAEALAELAGRSTALLGLRDSLYRACEAYANGAIGQDTYALVVSRYSQLMTTLFLGQDVSAAVATTVAAALPTVSSPSLTAGSMTTATVGSAPAAAAAPAAAPVAGAAPAAAPVAGAAVAGAPVAGAAPTAAPVAGAAPTAAPAAAAAPAVAPVAGTPASAAAPAAKIQVASAAPATASPPSAASTAALALTRMNEDYINEGPMGAILVACINEFDPTRDKIEAVGDPQPDDSGKMVHPIVMNAWLQNICSPTGLASLQSLFPDKGVHSVDPTAGLSPKPAAATAGSAAEGKSNPLIALVQQGLARAGFSPGKADGIAGPKTLAALKAYAMRFTEALPGTDLADPKVIESLVQRGYLKG